MQLCCFVREVRQVCSRGRSDKCRKRGHRADQHLFQDPSSTAPSGKGDQDKRKCSNSGKTGHLAASCQSKKKPLAAIEDGAFPAQCEVGSLTALSCDDFDLHDAYMLGCVAPGPGVGRASETQLLSYLTIDKSAPTSPPLGLGPCVPIFPARSTKRGELHQGAGAEKVQIMTLDVDQISRPLVL